MDFPTWFGVIAIIAVAVLAFLLFLALFEPGLDYRVEPAEGCVLDSEDFMRVIEALTDAKLHRRSTVEVLTNGEVYYEAELEAIRAAEHSVNIECYIFQKGDVARRFVDALTERARAGVRVRLVLDAVGSFATWDSYLAELRRAGGRVAWYHPLRWRTLARANNRTHRELFIVDGRVGFVGGAGVADHWLKDLKGKKRWRDTMFRVEGDLVLSLQSTFVENWLEASGELLSDDKYFPKYEAAGAGTAAFVVDSSPTAGGSTHARMLYQMLLASARESVLITTPYFLPDRSARRELVRAVRERGVEVSIIAPGSHSDHLLTRTSSRRLYGDLLRAGARIYEYRPAMLHAKTMVVDRVWSVVGSTNFDNRSFGLNDEVNLAAFDRRLAARVAEDFERDRAESLEITYDDWRRRPLWERGYEQVGRLLERQQ